MSTHAFFKNNTISLSYSESLPVSILKAIKNLRKDLTDVFDKPTLKDEKSEVVIKTLSELNLEQRSQLAIDKLVDPSGTPR